MPRALLAAVLIIGAPFSVSAGDLSNEAKILLYCSAAFVMADEQSRQEGDAADLKAVQEAVTIVKSRGKELLASEGFSDEEVELFAIMSVEQVLYELQNNKPRYYSQDQCEDVSKE